MVVSLFFQILQELQESRETSEFDVTQKEELSSYDDGGESNFLFCSWSSYFSLDNFSSYLVDCNYLSCLNKRGVVVVRRRYCLEEVVT